MQEQIHGFDLPSQQELQQLKESFAELLRQLEQLLSQRHHDNEYFVRRDLEEFESPNELKIHKRILMKGIADLEWKIRIQDDETVLE